MISLDSDRSKVYDIAIVGGGASGMACAVYSKMVEPNYSKQFSVALFERNNKLGKKLLTTGNGRCNVTNRNIDLEYYHGNQVSFAKEALSLYSSQHIQSFFEQIGLRTFCEGDGRVYPISLHAGSVLDCLRFCINDYGIEVFTSLYITEIEKVDGLFVLHTNDTRIYYARAVVIAGGGKCASFSGSDGNAYGFLKQFGHKIISPIPGIVQIKTETNFIKSLTGIKIYARASLSVDKIEVRSEIGEVLFTDYGLSGPPILQLSGLVSRALFQGISDRKRKKVVLRLDFLPQLSEQEIFAILKDRCNRFSNRKLDQLLVGMFHNRLAISLLKNATDKKLSSNVASLSESEMKTLSVSIKMLEIKVVGTMPLQNAQITIGGAATDQFDPVTMNSKICKGLFACGEVLDIDGDCGGYNLQWAWASGFAAAKGAVSYIGEICNES